MKAGRRLAGQPRVLRTVDRLWLIACNLTVRIERAGRRKPLVADASVARVGEVVWLPADPEPLLVIA